MATKDFRASQLETSKIIGTGSIAGTTVGIAIYSGSIASNRAGGVVAPHNTKMFESVGTDVFLFVSGTKSNDDNNRVNATLFGGDVVISGTLYAERQVIEVDSVADGDFFVTGSMFVEPDSNSTKSVAFRNAAGDDIFIVDSTNKRIGVNVPDPDAQVEILGTSTQLKLSNNADDFATFAVGTNGDLTITTVDAAAGAANFVIDADGAVDIDADAGALSLDGSAGINIGTETDVAIDIDASTLDIDASGALTIDSATSIYIGGTADKPVNIDSTTFVLDASSTVAIDGTGISIDAIGDSNITVTGTALVPKDLDISVVGGNTQELRLTSAGTGASALHLNATAGGVNIDSVANITLDGDRLLISDPSPPGTDTLFSVSGSIGSKGTAVKGTAVFGGDLVVSGNLHGGSPLKINDDIALTGSARFKEQSAPTAGPNEAVLYAKDVSGVSKLFTKQSDGLEVGPLGSGGSLNDAYDTPLGGGTKAAGVGAVITVDGQPVQIVRNTPGSIVLAVTGSSLFGETSVEFGNNLPPLPGDDTTFFVSGGMGSQGSTTGGTSVFGGDLVVSGNTRLHGNVIVGGAGNGTDSIFFDGGGGNSGPWIRGNTSVLTIDGDNRVDIRFAQQVKFAADSGTAEVVQIFEPSVGAATEPQLDALQIFSGSIGSRGTTTRGTTVFSGDVVASGTLRQAGSLHVYNHGITLQNGDRFFSPFQAGAPTPGSSIDNVKLHTLVPYSGSLERVILATRLGAITGGTVGLYVNGVLAGEMTGSTPSGATVFGGLSGIRIATFDFTGKSSTTVSGSVTFDANDFVTMQINGRAARDASVTSVFRLNDTVDPEEIILP